MEKLEQFISRNRSTFDNEEPLPGHFERFKQKMSPKIVTKKPNIFLVASAAAIAGLIITAGLSMMLTYRSMNVMQTKDMAVTNMSPEVSQIDDYYRNQVEKKSLVINSMITEGMEPLEVEINQTLDELNEGYNTIINDISITPNSERAVYALTLYYQAKLETMELIIFKLSNINKLNVVY